jgi:hypothetical protein
MVVSLLCERQMLRARLLVAVQMVRLMFQLAGQYPI